MRFKEIHSPQNSLIKHLTNLRKDRILREKEKRVLISGKKIVEDFPFPLELLITTIPNPSLKAKEMLLVTEEIFQKITGLKESQGLAAVVLLPKNDLPPSKGPFLILDRIQDPGNLGTLIRTAFALGWKGVLSTPDTVDFFNDKAIRAAAGASFCLPLSCQKEEVLKEFLSKHTLYLADLKGASLENLSLKKPYSLILSSEGKGPSKWAQKIGQKVTIPMTEKIDSLNVAAAGAILLYQMRPLP